MKPILTDFNYLTILTGFNYFNILTDKVRYYLLYLLTLYMTCIFQKVNALSDQFYKSLYNRKIKESF